MSLLRRTGSKSELILNVLIYTDFIRWEQRNLRYLLSRSILCIWVTNSDRIFIDMMKEITSQGHEQNRILLCYNPIMAICLCCEFLKKIGSNVNIFRHGNVIISNGLMSLGNKIVDNYDEEKIE